MRGTGRSLMEPSSTSSASKTNSSGSLACPPHPLTTQTNCIGNAGVNSGILGLCSNWAFERSQAQTLRSSLSRDLRRKMAWLFAMPPTLVTEKLIAKPPLIYLPREGWDGVVTKLLKIIHIYPECRLSRAVQCHSRAGPRDQHSPRHLE